VSIGYIGGRAYNRHAKCEAWGVVCAEVAFTLLLTEDAACFGLEGEE